MNMFRRCAGLIALSGCLWLRPALSADDIRQMVGPTAGSSAPSDVIDTSGVVFGVPFGSSEDEVMLKFGKPAGYLRLDAHRTALLYGRTYLLLCYDGKLDGLRIDDRLIDYAISKYIQEELPFKSHRWKLSNGITSATDREQAEKLSKSETGFPSYAITFSTEQCDVELGFFTDSSVGGWREKYSIGQLIMTAGREGYNHWGMLWARPRGAGYASKGKLLGMSLGDSLKGVRVKLVYKGSPADKAGIKPGDLITSLNGESVVSVGAPLFRDHVGMQDSNQFEVVSTDGNKRTLQLERADASTFSGHEIVGDMLAITEVKVGDLAPDFEAIAADGRKVRLSELRGSPVLIHFTELQCKPCADETTTLAGMAPSLRARGLQILSVYPAQNGAGASASAKEMGADWPFHIDGTDPRESVAGMYGSDGWPKNVLVGRDGKILHATRLNLQSDPDKLEFEAAIDEALKTP